MIQKKPLRTETKAVWAIALVFLLLASVLASLLFWAANNETNPYAKAIRQFIGIERSSEKPAIASDAEKKTTPAESVEPLPPEPEPLPPAPPTAITFSQLTTNADYWPRHLTLTAEGHLPIIFQGQSYGHLDFIPGSEIQIIDLKNPEMVIGFINGIEVTIPASHTNLIEWFENKHGEAYILRPLKRRGWGLTEKDTYRVADPADFSNDFKKWLFLNFDSIDYEITPDGILFNWRNLDDNNVNYRAEARRVARAYLIHQYAAGGEDNWAPCIIKDPRNGNVLGRASVFIPDIRQSD